MSQEKFYEEATKVAAKADDGVLDGSDGVDVKVTPEAAEQTGDNSIEGITKARGQRSALPMSEDSGVQDAIDALANENAELSLAFYGFVSLISGYVTSGVPFNAETLADEFERLAKEAGEQLARTNGKPPHPNTHLLLMANMMRKRPEGR